MRSERFPRLVLALVIAPLSSCGGGGEPLEPPNVILITIDTLRADHLGCYGYGEPTSPNIDAFARTATLYRRAVSTAPWTVPSHASLLTGRFPFQHGAHTVEVPHAMQNARGLAPDQRTLAETLVEEGYRTAAFIANSGYLSRSFQLDQGFATYAVQRLPSRALNERVFAWLSENRNEPFFVWVNYMDVHKPYNVEPRPELDVPEFEESSRELLARMYQEVFSAGRVDPVLAQRIIAQYDVGIRNVDASIRDLLDELERLDLVDQTVVVLTSDHGEFFGEHELVEHSKDVYEEVLAVPLLVRLPGQTQGREDDTMVSSVDVPRLILDAFPRDVRDRLAAQFPYAVGEHLVISENYYARPKDLFHPVWGERFDRVRRAVYWGPYKYIYSSDGAHELYDLSRDPTEEHDLIDSEPEVARGLALRLKALQSRGPEYSASQEVPELTAAEIETLRALGYF